MLSMGYLINYSSSPVFTSFSLKMAMRFTENLNDDEDFRININLMAIIVTTVN